MEYRRTVEEARSVKIEMKDAVAAVMYCDAKERKGEIPSSFDDFVFLVDKTSNENRNTETPMMMAAKIKYRKEVKCVRRMKSHRRKISESTASFGLRKSKLSAAFALEE